MKLSIKPYLTSFLILGILSVDTLAEEILINGFLSAGMSRQTNNTVSVASFSTDYNVQEDTILGIQLSKQLTDEFSVTGQLVGRGNEDYKVDASWIYASYQPTDETFLRVGRIIMPLFYFSEFIEVGYGYNWIRPPEEVYRFPFSTMNAIDVNHQFYLGDLEANAQFYVGNIINEVFQGVSLDARNTTGIVLNANYNYLNFRASYHQTEVDSPFDPDNAAVNPGLAAIWGGAQAIAGQLGLTQAQGLALANEFLYDPEETNNFVQFSTAYNDEINLILFEWTAITGSDSTAAFLDDEGWLIHFSRKINNFTPHFTYAIVTNETATGNLGAVQTLLTLERDISSIIVGVRHDVAEGVALKYEVQQKNIDVMLFPSGSTDDDAFLYGFAVDIVF